MQLSKTFDQKLTLFLQSITYKLSNFQIVHQQNIVVVDLLQRDSLAMLCQWT